MSLVWRSLALLLLISRAVFVVVCGALIRRGVFPARPEALSMRRRAFARHFVAVATRFKGGLIKLGQVASLRLDVLPDEVTAELARLQDRVPAHPYGEIAAQVERELGAPPEVLFAAFNREPLAAASLGQVHRARTRDGSELAVKVLYPGIERSVAVDLAMTRVALWLFDFLTITDLRLVYREIRQALLGEMDYVREGRAAEEIGSNLRRDPELRERVRVPTIEWKLTTRRVLAMEFLEGVKINESPALAAGSRERAELVLWASRAFLHMIFRDGFFHCDPHPGNLLVDGRGHIGIVDFGMNQRVAPELVAALRKHVVAAVTRDKSLWAESLIEAGVVAAADRPALLAIAELAFDPAYYNLTPQEVMNLDFAEPLRSLRRQLKRIDSFHLPEGLVMGSRAVSLLYGLLSELAPGVRPLDVLAPYAAEFLRPDVPPASKSV